MTDTYSGTSLAMTLVADDGARPSPSPTCNVMIPCEPRTSIPLWLHSMQDKHDDAESRAVAVVRLSRYWQCPVHHFLLQCCGRPHADSRERSLPSVMWLQDTLTATMENILQTHKDSGGTESEQADLGSWRSNKGSQ